MFVCDEKFRMDYSSLFYCVIYFIVLIVRRLKEVWFLLFVFWIVGVGVNYV